MSGNLHIVSGLHIYSNVGRYTFATQSKLQCVSYEYQNVCRSLERYYYVNNRYTKLQQQIYSLKIHVLLSRFSYFPGCIGMAKG